MRLVRTVAVLVLAAGVLASLYVAAMRWDLERSHDRVAIVIDYEDAQKLSLLCGHAADQVLGALREAGAEACAVYEDTLAGLEEEGRLSLRRGAAGSMVAISPDPDLLRRIARHVHGRLPGQEILDPQPYLSGPGAAEYALDLPAAAVQYPALGLGFDPAEIVSVAGAGLSLVARPSAQGVATAQGAAFVIEETAATGAEAVVFAGAFVLGYRDNLKDVAELLAERQLPYASLEFGKQYGDAGLSRHLRGQVLRAHAITETEMITMSPREAGERFLRAARERGIRLLYVRLFLHGSSPALEKNYEYIADMYKRLSSAGFTSEMPQPLPRMRLSVTWRLAGALGVIAGGLLLLTNLLPLSGRTLLLLACLGVMLAACGLSTTPVLTRKVFALLAALIFPTLALARLRPGSAAELDTIRQAAGTVLRQYLACAGLSLCGAALIVGLLSDTSFMSHTDLFSGVKVSLWLPLPMVAVIHLGQLYGRGESVADQWRRSLQNWAGVLRGPVLYWQVVIIIGVLAAAALILLRSGHEMGVGASDVEMRFRDALERALVVRPRQKEFLVGHPLLILTLGLIALGRVRGMWLGLMGAAIGQTSMVNTFCHIHTPLSVSLLRTFHGLWLGAVLGLLLLIATVAVWRRTVPPPAEGPDEPAP